MSKVVFISCVSMKLAHPAAAGDLYTSPLFKMNLRYARGMQPNAIYILSAKYGLAGLTEVLEPYNETLNTMRDGDIRRWAERVREQMKGKIDFQNDEAVFLAGERYRKYLMPLFRRAEAPLKGLGIGRQLQFLKRALSHAE